MNILVSAYACEPDRGSEPGQGWNWAMAWAGMGHRVWVLTCRAHHEDTIRKSLSTKPLPPELADRVRFIFHDPAGWPGPGYDTPRFVRSHYLAWQWTVRKVARRLHAEHGFDLVHHVSWGVIRQPSFLGNLGAPLVFGPVGGGERTPWKLRRGFSAKGHVMEVLRDLLNGAVRLDPMMRRTFAQASVILCKTSETAALVPKAYRAKTRVFLEVFADPATQTGARPTIAEGPLRVLYVGRLLHWKGAHLALEAFARLAAVDPDAHLTLVGKGPESARLHAQAAALGITNRIDWHEWLAQPELHALYAAHSVFLFPSLHDSSGNVVLEALGHGLPVVCLGLGGPKEMVDETCGRVIPADHHTVEEVVAGLGEALIDLRAHPALLASLSRGAAARAGAFSANVRPAALVRLIHDVGQVDMTMPKAVSTTHVRGATS
ncbi:MAG: glycosyltransferase family 4 protein [Rhodospirillaceae bacterium]